ncbi:MAG: hypothetical protein HQM16_14430, partial [Deltaproteobacteria bacterium]|nr:hypothetical protein [Deltaproteobacteria bacterium]
MLYVLYQGAHSFVFFSKQKPEREIVMFSAQANPLKGIYNIPWESTRPILTQEIRSAIVENYRQGASACMGVDLAQPRAVIQEQIAETRLHLGPGAHKSEDPAIKSAYQLTDNVVTVAECLERLSLVIRGNPGNTRWQCLPADFDIYLNLLNQWFPGETDPLAVLNKGARLFLLIHGQNSPHDIKPREACVWLATNILAHSAQVLLGKNFAPTNGVLPKNTVAGGNLDEFKEQFRARGGIWHYPMDPLRMGASFPAGEYDRIQISLVPEPMTYIIATGPWDNLAASEVIVPGPIPPSSVLLEVDRASFDAFLQLQHGNKSQFDDKPQYAGRYFASALQLILQT